MHSFMCFRYVYYFIGGFPGGSEVKASASNAGDLGLIPGWGRSLGEGNGTPLQYSRLEKSHGWRSLVGYGSWGLKESDTTEIIQYNLYNARSLVISTNVCLSR